MLIGVNSEVLSSVESLSRIFTIVLALSIGEAFKQFVSDKEGTSGKIFGWRLPSLIAFIALVVPFSHGMTRYFYQVYMVSALPESYSVDVFVDTIFFTVESAMFFILSRSLAVERWMDFFVRFGVLLFLDILWGSVVGARHEDVTLKWVKVNVYALILLVVLSLVYYLLKRYAGWKVSDKAGAIIVMVFVLTRTCFDYASSFDFYFPNP